MADLKKVLVVEAAYNEGRTIRQIVEAIPHFRNKFVRLDVMVVNDHSTDNTVDQASGIPGVTVVTPFNMNRGKTACVKYAFEHALANGYDAVVTMDADGQHEPADILRIIDSLEQYDVVFTSRYHSESKMRSYPPTDRFLLNVMYASLVRKLTGMNLTDPACGLRGIRRSTLEQLKIITDRYGLEMETVFRVWKMPNVHWAELPIAMIYNGEGKIGAIYGADQLPQRLQRITLHLEDIMVVLDDMGVDVSDLLEIIHKRNGR